MKIEIQVTKSVMFRIDPQRIADMFNIFNTSGDGSMSIQEFHDCYEKWIKKIVRPKSALVSCDWSTAHSFLTCDWSR